VTPPFAGRFITQSGVESRDLLPRLGYGKVTLDGRPWRGIRMKSLAVSAVLLCVGAMGAEDDLLLKVGDTLVPCYPTHVAGPDNKTNECAV